MSPWWIVFLGAILAPTVLTAAVVVFVARRVRRRDGPANDNRRPRRAG
ncbi:MAG: hypothetical protein KDK07_07905 [Bauldia sp.]|nr:hypothetical protein [Bauldia sp.]